MSKKKLYTIEEIEAAGKPPIASEDVKSIDDFILWAQQNPEGLKKFLEFSMKQLDEIIKRLYNGSR